VSALSDLLSQAIEREGKSLRRLAEEAQGQGHTLNHSTISRLRAGTTRDLDEETMVALAAVLPVTVDELRVAAGLPAGEAEPYVAPPEFSRLTYRQRALLDELVRSFVATEEERHAQEVPKPQPSEGSPPPSSPSGEGSGGGAPIVGRPIRPAPKSKSAGKSDVERAYDELLRINEVAASGQPVEQEYQAEDYPEGPGLQIAASGDPEAAEKDAREREGGE